MISTMEQTADTVLRHNAAFRVDNLSVAFNGQTRLSNVSVAAPMKQVTAIIGPSGAGKSTLLRALNRMLELTPGASITSGRVNFKGEDIYDDSVDVQILRKRICMLLQKPVAFPMSIKENVLFGVRFHKNWNGKTPDEIVQTCLKRAGLWDEVKDRLNSEASSLSVGQLQRLCIARGLANEPEAFLMDEPCSALDPVSTAKIEELICFLKRDLPIFIVTHNLAQARRISDHCLFLCDGMSLEEGPTEHIFSAPENEKTRDFITGRIG